VLSYGFTVLLRYPRKHFLHVRVFLLFLAIALLPVRETKQYRRNRGEPLCVFRGI
jgi:hypothetical protein